MNVISLGERLSRAAAWAGGILLLLTSVLIALEVVLRKVFTVSMGGADEISSYAMAVSCSFGFAYALFQKAHIRIDILYNRCGKTLRYLLDILSLSLLGTYMTVLSYFGFQVFYISFTKGATANTPLHTPLWIPQLIWILGIWGFTLAIFLVLGATLFHFLNQDKPAARKLSGASDLETELESVSETSEPDTFEPMTGGAR